MLKNAPTLAIGGADTAENEPPKVRQVSNKIRRNIGARSREQMRTPEERARRAEARVHVRVHLVHERLCSDKLYPSPDELSTVRSRLYRQRR